MSINSGSRPAGSTAGAGGNWYSRRRQRKKRRLAAMSWGRRLVRRLAIVFTWLLALLVAALVVSVVAFYQLSRVPSPTAQPVLQSYTITYADGSPMYQGGEVTRTDVALSRVPQHVQDAVLAAEDRGFYSEHGASLRGTARAALNDVRGGDAQGGSGITQQYVKNHYLNSSRTLTRKLRELAIAVKLDRDYSKAQILDWYLNSIYFGRGTYGIQAASQSYFHKDVDRLTVSEGALLAGIIQAPSSYDPSTAQPLAQQRWNYVLDGMVSTGKLPQTARDAMTFPKVYPEQAQSGATGPTALIVRQVKAELGADGVNSATLNTGGLRIQTTIVKSAQAQAVAAIGKAYGHVSPKNKGRLRESLVAVDPSDGAVVAYYGGTNDKTAQRDYAQNWTAPGSSFKPFTLAAVLQANVAGRTLTGPKPAYTITSTVDGSEPYDVDGLKIHNDDSDRRYSYPQSIRSAMTRSLNTVFARLAHSVGPDEVVAAARAAGVPAKTTGTAPNPGKPTLEDAKGDTSVTIGYGDYPYTVRPIDQATSFATLADGGVQHNSYFIAKISNAKGKVLYQHVDAGHRAFDPRVANDTTLAMEDVASWSKLSLAGNRTVAAKTGTVGKGASDASDAWTVGFTPQISVASWAGTDGVQPIYRDDGGTMYGRWNPGLAWKYFMDAYLDGKPKAALPSEQEIGPGAATGSPTAIPSSATPSSTVPSSTAPSSTAPPPTTPSSTVPSSTAPSSTAPPSTTPPSTQPPTPPSTTPRTSSTTAPTSPNSTSPSPRPGATAAPSSGGHG